MFNNPNKSEFNILNISNFNPFINSSLVAFSLGMVFGFFSGIVLWLRMIFGDPKPMGHEILWVTPLLYGLFGGIFFILSAGFEALILCSRKFRKCGPIA